jgi:uncharacterized membrane protein
MRLETIARAAGLGVATGMRTFIAAATLSRGLAVRKNRRKGPLRRRGLNTGDALSGLLASRMGGRVIATVAASELGFDKMPFVGSRIDPRPLAVRALVGGLVGWVAGDDDGEGDDRDRLIGAGIGAACAVGGAWAAYHLRRRLTTERGLPDVAVATAEDAIAGFIATAASGGRILLER